MVEGLNHMKKYLLVLCLVALLSVVGWTSYGQKQNSQRVTFEYMVKPEGGINNHLINLNALGAGGWELTAVTAETESIGEYTVPIKYYYFKRQK
jgi:hypothetical protein